MPYAIKAFYASLDLLLKMIDHMTGFRGDHHVNRHVISHFSRLAYDHAHAMELSLAEKKSL
jgi:hypothetical protein